MTDKEKLLLTETPVPIKPMFGIAGEPQKVRDARQHILTEFGDLEFFEGPHRYFLYEKELHSVSKVAERFQSSHFDTEAQAASVAMKRGHTPEYWKREWACNNFKSTTLGTKTHEFGESLAYLKAGHPEFITEMMRSQYNEKYGYLAPIHPKEEAAEKFLNDLPSCYHLVLNETRVYSGKNPDESKNLKEQLCGTFDMLYWYDGDGDPSRAGFIVFDYKTNGSLRSDYNRKFGVMLLPPFSEYYQENEADYAIQLSLYSLMLEDIGLKVIDRKLIWLQEDGTYQKVTVPDLSDRLRKVL